MLPQRMTAPKPDPATVATPEVEVETWRHALGAEAPAPAVVPIPEPEDRVRAVFAEAAANFVALGTQSVLVVAAAERITAALASGNKVLFCGNGGSAADSQHLAAEFMGRFLKDRAPLPAIALTVDTSALTAIGNDYGFDDVFARQLRGLGRAGDVLVALSTSGNSRNILAAIAVARQLNISVIGLTGEGGGAMGVLCDICFRVPSSATPRIQEMHIAIGHMICELVEDELIAIQAR